MQHYVYVLNKNGEPLMPTTRYGWVRRSLKSGKAVAVKTVPFTIKLTYEIEKPVTQPVRVGTDSGRINIGLSAIRNDGKCLFRAKCITRNDKIPELMAHRKTHRHGSRRGERLVRKRRAKKFGTLMSCCFVKRKLPGYKEGYVIVKDIINTEAKFNNRRHKKGQLTTVSAKHLLQTHINLIKLMCKILPVTDVSCEINKFDFQKMENPKIKRWEYGLGPLHGHGTIRKALISLQGGKCLLCGKGKIEHDHHIVPRSMGGSDTIQNIAGICLKCHEKLHEDPKAVDKLSKKKKGLNKKYHHLSLLNQILPFFFNDLAELFPDHTYAVTGKGTASFRKAFGYDKDHDVDAYCIAAATMENITVDHNMPPCYEIRQFRRHDRAIIKAQVQRSYYYEGKKVAQNRHKATEAIVKKDGTIKYKMQAYPSLEDWFKEMEKKYGTKEAECMRSHLQVMKSYRRYNDLDRILPGAIFYYKGNRYIKKSQITNGEYLLAIGQQKDGKDINFPAAECTVYPNRGLVFVL
jgi:hypothetical protein